MPVIYPLLRICVGRKIRPSMQGSEAVRAGYGNQQSRPRQKFSQLEEGSDKKQLWTSKLGNSSSGSSGQDRDVGDDIPMGRIMVTRGLEVERN